MECGKEYYAAARSPMHEFPLCCLCDAVRMFFASLLWHVSIFAFLTSSYTKTHKAQFLVCWSDEVEFFANQCECDKYNLYVLYSHSHDSTKRTVEDYQQNEADLHVEKHR